MATMHGTNSEPLFGHIYQHESHAALHLQVSIAKRPGELWMCANAWHQRALSMTVTRWARKHNHLRGAWVLLKWVFLYLTYVLLLQTVLVTKCTPCFYGEMEVSKGTVLILNAIPSLSNTLTLGCRREKLCTNSHPIFPLTSIAEFE